MFVLAMMNAILLFISGQEILVIVLIVVLLFGTKRLPEIARGLGKGMNEFKKATSDIKREFDQQAPIVNDVKKVKHQIQESTGKIKNRIEESEIGKDFEDVKNVVDKMGNTPKNKKL